MNNFAPTLWSLVSRLKSDNDQTARQALEELCAIYRPAIFSFAVQALRGDEAEAEDLTQEFFLDLLQRGRMLEANQDLGKFRTFLLTHFKFVLLDRLKRQRAERRGAAFQHVPVEELTDQDAPFVLPAESDFDRLWVQAMIRKAISLLQEEHRKSSPVSFEDLKGNLPGFSSLSRPSYPELSTRYGISEGTLRTQISRLRSRYRDILYSLLADTVTDQRQFEDERQALLAGLVKTLQ